MQNTNKPKLLTVKQAAETYDNLTVWRIRQWIKDGTLPVIPLQKKHLIPSNAIEYVLFGQYDHKSE